MLFWKCRNFTPFRSIPLSFNPYSVGCCSGREKPQTIPRRQPQFQSLFCWMLFWKRLGCVFEFPFILFQSLFCWMLFWKGLLGSWFYRAFFVSILILLDVVLEVEPPARGGSVEFDVSILILLDVVLEVFSFWSLTGVATCFNPYSVGCCSGSFIHLVSLLFYRKFQSLFCWMLFWKEKTA